MNRYENSRVDLGMNPTWGSAMLIYQGEDYKQPDWQGSPDP